MEPRNSIRVIVPRPALVDKYLGNPTFRLALFEQLFAADWPSLGQFDENFTVVSRSPNCASALHERFGRRVRSPFLAAKQVAENFNVFAFLRQCTR